MNLTEIEIGIDWIENFHKFAKIIFVTITIGITFFPV